jgi:hypothetical protein
MRSANFKMTERVWESLSHEDQAMIPDHAARSGWIATAAVAFLVSGAVCGATVAAVWYLVDTRVQTETNRFRERADKAVAELEAIKTQWNTAGNVRFDEVVAERVEVRAKEGRARIVIEHGERGPLVRLYYADGLERARLSVEGGRGQLSLKSSGGDFWTVSLTGEENGGRIEAKDSKNNGTFHVYDGKTFVRELMK